MARHFKAEGNIIYPDKTMLTWGPFYYHSLDKAKAKMIDIMDMITKWVNEQDKTLNIKPEDIVNCSVNTMTVFKIKAWKDEKTLQDCNGIITVDEIFFEDEKNVLFKRKKK